MPGVAASEPPSVTLSFANNFWGKDDAGVGPMLERLHNAKVTSDELKSFYSARSAIEEEYSRKLLHLSRKPLGSSESGTLRLSLDVVRAEVEAMGKAHQNIAGQMKTELEEPLAAFSGGMKERRKIVQNGIEKLLKIKMQQTIAVNKARDRYENDCLKIKGFLAQAHMVMGQEERKNKAKLEKTQIQLSTTSAEYEAAVKVLEETTGRWNRDWKAACDKFQDLEEERIDYMKSCLWTFANIASTVCVSDDAACEKIRLSLEDCDVEKDITAFIKDSGTGQEIPDPPKFINFCRGDAADSASEASDEGNYSVAQFQRTMNPAFRTSSPQPSVFESHHDPNNPLAKELGLKDTNPVSLQEYLPPQPANPSLHDQEPLHMPSSRGVQPDPRSLNQQPQGTQPSSRGAQPDPRLVDRQNPNAQSSRGVQPDPRLIQAQQQAHQQYQQNQVQHNDYPMDGMTQFCRVGAPSERASGPSPARPSSRDSASHSDYSNPTSFSSIEPPSGSASPGKPMAPTPQPLNDDKQVQKKKSGFFQNHSPFRRKSKHENTTPAPSIAPSASRNTWGPVSKRGGNENMSPTRPFTKGSRGTVLGGDARSSSPEPVDPRANFQLNIGNNVFDVASPDGRKEEASPKNEELDPIAQALEELKGVTKQTSLRMSADRYHGLATPVPPGTPGTSATPVGGVPTPLTNGALNAAQRGTPPPSYEQPPMSRLGAPQPAFTSRQMKQTTQKYVNQKTSIFNGSASRPETSSRPIAQTSSRPTAQTNSRPIAQTNSRPTAQTNPRPTAQTNGQRQEVPRATSPAPPRARSPRPGLYASQSAQPTSVNRSVSPNPYAASNAGTRSRAQSTSPIKQYGNNGGRESVSSSRGVSPGYVNIPRAASPNPTVASIRAGSRAAGSRAVSPVSQFRQSYDRPVSRAVSPAPQFQPSYDRQAPRAVSPQPQFRQSYDRPSSSRGSDMALQLAPGPGSERGDGSVYGGSQRGRGGGGTGRPMSHYGGGGGSDLGYSGSQASNRARSKSLAEPRQYTKDGRMILHYSRAMYMYQAQIPEELSFAKGDILAVLRMQDDGWWEAEVVGKNGSRPGLVPSNYLQNC